MWHLERKPVIDAKSFEIFSKRKCGGFVPELGIPEKAFGVDDGEDIKPIKQNNTKGEG